MNIQLGSKVRDRITGFTGIATSRHEYLNGCVRISISPRVGGDGRMVEAEAFDIQQIEVLEQPPQGAPNTGAATGGDRELNAPHR